MTGLHRGRLRHLLLDVHVVSGDLLQPGPPGVEHVSQQAAEAIRGSLQPTLWVQHVDAARSQGFLVKYNLSLRRLQVWDLVPEPAETSEKERRKHQRRRAHRHPDVAGCERIVWGWIFSFLYHPVVISDKIA